VSAATTADQRIAQQRHSDVRRAVQHLREGESAAAHERLCMTVELQALLAGCGMVTLPRPL
jgi:hypothetical protein